MKLIRQGAKKAVAVSQRGCGVETKRAKLFSQELIILGWVRENLRILFSNLISKTTEIDGKHVLTLPLLDLVVRERAIVNRHQSSAIIIVYLLALTVYSHCTGGFESL